jgi:DNA-binding transcriptional LysR family regulator
MSYGDVILGRANRLQAGRDVVISGRHFDIRTLRAFVAVVSTGSVTKAARLLCRTQPAITLQIRRLEEQTERRLFDHGQKQPRLTRDGEILLGYARAILQMHDEVWNRLHAKAVVGRVVLGTPDLYAAYLLPSILSSFREAYPNVEVDLRCAPSRTLVEELDSKTVDIALITGMPGIREGEFIRKEQLVWVTSPAHEAHRENPVPLALLPPGNIYRDMAIAALDRIGRPWRLACVSESIGGLQAAVFSGFAVSVVAKSALVPGMRMIGRSESFPGLPSVDLVLHRAPAPASLPTEKLADFVARVLVQKTEGAHADDPAVIGAGSPSVTAA